MNSNFPLVDASLCQLLATQTYLRELGLYDKQRASFSKTSEETFSGIDTSLAQGDLATLGLLFINKTSCGVMGAKQMLATSDYFEAQLTEYKYTNFEGVLASLREQYSRTTAVLDDQESKAS